MSNNGNNGTGFWVIVALIVVMSLVAVLEAGGKLLLATARKLFDAVPSRRSAAGIRNC